MGGLKGDKELDLGDMGNMGLNGVLDVTKQHCTTTVRPQWAKTGALGQ